MKVKIVGPGCKSCKALYSLALDAKDSFPLGTEVEHINDIEQMLSYGITNSPALVINDKVISQGVRLSKKELIELVEKNL